MIFRISSISFREVSGIANDCASVWTGSIRILLPRVSVDSAAGMSVGVITVVVTALLVGVLAEMIIGLGTAFGGATTTRMMTGPETAFRGAISRENILPLRVILLVPAILLILDSIFSELESSVAGQSCLIPC